MIAGPRVPQHKSTSKASVLLYLVACHRRSRSADLRPTSSKELLRGAAAHSCHSCTRRKLEGSDTDTTKLSLVLSVKIATASSLSSSMVCIAYLYACRSYSIKLALVSIPYTYFCHVPT